MIHITLQTLILKSSKTLIIILTLFLNFIHVLLTLQIFLLSPHQTQILPTHIRAPLVPYNLRPLSPKGYYNSKPTINFLP